MTPDEITILQQARNLIHEGWTQRAYARNHQGQECMPENTGATCFCIKGALLRALHLDDPTSKYARYVNLGLKLNKLTPQGHLSRFNDDPNTTLQDVLDFFDHALQQPLE